MDESGRSAKAIEPPMTLGTMYFGTKVPRDVAVRILDDAYDAGVTSWDTANNYAFWMPGGTGDESESVIGQWIRAHPGRRETIRIATKVGARPRPGGKSFADAIGLSAQAIRDQVHDSLRRLRTDHVDLLYAHIDDREVPLAETLAAMEALQQEGSVRQIGASNLTVERLRSAIAASAPSAGYRFLQQRFTYLSPTAATDLSPHVLLDDAVAAECSAAGVAMLGYLTLLSGAYARPDRPLPQHYDTPSNRHALRTLRDVAHATGLDAGQTVLAWMTQREISVEPVVGVSSPAQVHSALRAVRTKLSDQALATLEAARMGA